jgi:hypothetical protein
MSTLYVDNLQPNLGSRVMAAGHVVQVVQTNDGTHGSVTSTSYTSTPITATITPTSTTSKVLIRAVFLFGQSRSSTNRQDHIKKFTLYRGSTNIAPYNSSFFQHQNQVGDGEVATFTEQTQVAVIEFLDSPSTTSPTTYTVYCRSDNSTITISINGRGAGAGLDGTTAMTLMEIAQ